MTTNHFKDRIPKNLTSGIVYKIQCRLCNESYCGEYLIQLNVRIGKHIGILALNKKQVKPKNSSITKHLLFCNHSASYDDLTFLTREDKVFT